MLEGGSLDQLRIFVAAADEGSFSAAGRCLKRTQSFVSLTVSNLERELGVRLFDRTIRPPVLTDQGRALLANARAVINQMDLLKARAKGLAGGSEPELSVVVDALFPIAQFARVIAGLQEKFPETAIRLNIEHWDVVVQNVLDRRCALGMLMPAIPIPPQLVRERLMTVKVATVVSAQHPLAAQRQPIPRKTFAKHIQMLHMDPSRLSVSHPSAVLSPKTWILGNNDAKLAFLRAGCGFSTVPLHVVEQDLASGTLVQLRFEDSAVFDAIEMSMLYRIDSPPGPAGRWLIEHLMQEDGQRLDRGAGGSRSAVRPRSSRSRSQRSKH
jgi:DNA-binding transcriptional LysR family regulator